MNILYILHQFFPIHYTGTERHTLDIAKQMQRMGNYAAVLTYEPSFPRRDASFSKNWFTEDANNLEDGFENVDDFIKKREYQIETIPVVALKYHKNRISFEIFEPALEKYLEGLLSNFDVVHFTHPARLASALKVCKKLKIPTILTLTDNWLLCDKNLVTIDKNLCSGPQEGKECIRVCNYGQEVVSRYNEAKFFFDNVDRVFSGTKFVMQTFWENGWKKKIELNNFAVDYSSVEIKDAHDDELVFAFIGSLMWHKGLHVLIEAFKKVKSKKIKLKIYGNADTNNEYAMQTVDLVGGVRIDGISNNDERIEFCGTFDYEDFSKIMQNVSVIVIPSVYKEIYPLVMQTALAFKKPVIASDIGGIPEVILNEINGFLFPVGDENELAKIIQMISDNPKILDKLKQNISPPKRIEEECATYDNAYNDFYFETSNNNSHISSVNQIEETDENKSNPPDLKYPEKIFGELERAVFKEKFSINVNELEVGGWSFSSHGIDLLIEIFIDDELVGDVKPTIKRPVVFKIHPSYKKAFTSGFSKKINIKKINEGKHVLKVISRSNKKEQLLKKVNFQIDNKPNKK